MNIDHNDPNPAGQIVMTPLHLHPATRQLIRHQRMARITQMIDRVRSPRRLTLTIVAVLLGVAWAGQAAASILLRQPTELATVQKWIPLTLLAYGLWNLLKTTCGKTVEPFEWTPSEREWLISAPLRTRELIKYRFSTIAMAAVAKSTIFSLVMIPDLPILPLGFAGIFLSLIMIDLFRLHLEVFVDGLNQRERVGLKVSVISVTAVVALLAVVAAVENSQAGNEFSTVASFGFLMNLLQGVIQQTETPIGALLMSPFQYMTQCILSESWTWQAMATLVLAAVVILTAFEALVRSAHFFRMRRRSYEHDQLDVLRTAVATATPIGAQAKNRIKPVRLGGAGPLAWRQWLGTRNYRTSLFFAMLVPFVLSCLPAMTRFTGIGVFLNICAGLAFYCFLLLPSALKFDFRRDFDRLALLKSLPVSPIQTVLGQLALPVLLTTLFQVAVLVVSMWLKPFHPSLFFVAMAILIPFNLCVFAYENLIYIWYPHKVGQEGVQVLLRSVLAFTAKGLIFTFALLGLLIWIFIANEIGLRLAPQDPLFAMEVVFSIGGAIAMLAAATVLVRLTARAFENFDPSSDLAGLN